MLTPEQRREQLRALADSRRAAREAAEARRAAAVVARQERGEVRSQEARIIREREEAMPGSKATHAGAAQRSRVAVAQNRKALQEELGKFRKGQTAQERRASTQFGRTSKVSTRGDGMKGASATLADPNANRSDARSEVERQGGASLVDPNQGRDVRVNRGGSMVDGPAAGDARRYGRDSDGRAMNKREFDRVESMRAEARELEATPNRTAAEERRLEQIRGEVEGVTRPGERRREVVPDPAQAQGQAEPQRAAAGAAVGGAVGRGQAVPEREAEPEQAGVESPPVQQQDRGVYQWQGGKLVQVGEEGDVFQMRFGRAVKVGKEGDVFQRRLGRIEKVGEEGDTFVRQLGGWLRVQDARPPITRLRTVTRTNEILASARVAARRGRVARGVVIP